MRGRVRVLVSAGAGRPVARFLSLSLLLTAVAVIAAPAHAQAPADTSFGQYLDTLRDSTDLYFGRGVAPVDTAGLDSALASGLARPGSRRRVAGTWHVSLAPWLGFNRVDGPLYGAAASTGRRR